MAPKARKRARSEEATEQSDVQPELPTSSSLLSLFLEVSEMHLMLMHAKKTRSLLRAAFESSIDTICESVLHARAVLAQEMNWMVQREQAKRSSSAATPAVATPSAVELQNAAGALASVILLPVFKCSLSARDADKCFVAPILERSAVHKLDNRELRVSLEELYRKLKAVLAPLKTDDARKKKGGSTNPAVTGSVSSSAQDGAAVSALLGGVAISAFLACVLRGPHTDHFCDASHTALCATPSHLSRGHREAADAEVVGVDAESLVLFYLSRRPQDDTCGDGLRRRECHAAQFLANGVVEHLRAASRLQLQKWCLVTRLPRATADAATSLELANFLTCFLLPPPSVGCAPAGTERVPGNESAAAAVTNHVQLVTIGSSSQALAAAKAALDEPLPGGGPLPTRRAALEFLCRQCSVRFDDVVEALATLLDAARTDDGASMNASISMLAARRGNLPQLPTAEAFKAMLQGPDGGAKLAQLHSAIFRAQFPRRTSDRSVPAVPAEALPSPSPELSDTAASDGSATPTQSGKGVGDKSAEESPTMDDSDNERDSSFRQRCLHFASIPAHVLPLLTCATATPDPYLQLLIRYWRPPFSALTSSREIRQFLWKDELIALTFNLLAYYDGDEAKLALMRQCKMSHPNTVRLLEAYHCFTANREEATSLSFVCGRTMLENLTHFLLKQLR